MTDDQSYLLDEPEDKNDANTDGLSPFIAPDENDEQPESDVLSDLRQALIDSEKAKDTDKKPAGFLRKVTGLGQEGPKENSEPSVPPFRIRPNPSVPVEKKNPSAFEQEDEDVEEFRARLLGHPVQMEPPHDQTPQRSISLAEANQGLPPGNRPLPDQNDRAGRRRLSPHTGYLDESTWHDDGIEPAPDLLQTATGEQPYSEPKTRPTISMAGAESKTQPQKVIAYTPNNSTWDRINRWYNQITPLEKGLVWLLNFALIGLFLLLVYLYSSRFLAPQVVPAATPTRTPAAMPGDIPIPSGVELPGGWRFVLQKSQNGNGKWNPVQPEWLAGTEVRRVVAIPWSRQLDAVIQTLVPGDIIRLEMSNGDLLNYKVDSVSQVASSDSSILTGSSPSLVLILFSSTSDKRWTVLAVP